MGRPHDSPLRLTQGQQLMTNMFNNLYKEKKDYSPKECFGGDRKVIYLDCEVKVIELHTLNRCIIKLYLTEVDFEISIN